MIPVTLVSGYLGAGKTTLINAVLRNDDGNRIAVLVNEFGALPIDADLIEAQDDRLISISGGCVCCSFGDDLAGGLRDLAALDPKPDHVVIEASGVALPGSIMATVALVPGVTQNAIVVLADATGIEGLLLDPFLADTVERQLQGADRIVVTKSDLLHPKGVSQCTANLAARWPEAEYLMACNGKVSRAQLLAKAPERQHDMAPHTVDDIHDSFELEPRSFDAIEDLEAALRSIGTGVLRAKGFVSLGTGQKVLIQAVGQRISVSDSQDVGSPRLVVITRKDSVTQAQIEAALQTAQTLETGTST